MSMCEIKRRQRSNHTVTFQDPLAAFAKDSRDKASFLPPCAGRNDLLKKARMADDAAHLDDWARALFSELAR